MANDTPVYLGFHNIAPCLIIASKNSLWSAAPCLFVRQRDMVLFSEFNLNTSLKLCLHSSITGHLGNMIIFLCVSNPWEQRTLYFSIYCTVLYLKGWGACARTLLRMLNVLFSNVKCPFLPIIPF